MRSLLLPFALALAVTLLIGIGVGMEPYFAGDVRAARALQSLSPDPGWWAAPISRLPTAPAKYVVMAITIVMAVVLGGWRGLLIAMVAITADQWFGEASKEIFGRPRPSPDLIHVAGTPRGYTFPSTTMTFASVTFGLMALLTLPAKTRRHFPLRTAVMIVCVIMLIASGAARVALGAHWPSDVVLTVLITMTWLWAAVRACFA